MRPSDDGYSQKPEGGLRIQSDRLLLVEGRDEVNFLSVLIRECIGEDAGVQLIDAGGKDQFATNLEAIRISAKTRPTLGFIGVIRDADDDARGAFESVRSALRKVGYESPSSHGNFSDSSPSIGIFIVPDGVSSGAIETLCRRSVENSAAGRCVNMYLDCLVEHNAMESSNKDKSFSHAYLASMRNPVARVGEGALGGAWNFDSPVFRDILDFIRTLQSQ